MSTAFTPSVVGAFSARNIVGDTTGTAAPAGYIGELIEFTRGAFSVNSSSPSVVQSLGTLQKGIYLLNFNWAISSSANLSCEAKLRKTTGGVKVKGVYINTLSASTTSFEFTHVFKVDTVEAYDVTIQNSSGGGTINIEGDEVNQTGTVNSSHRYQLLRIA